ncbi:hypothetical protein [Rahnella sp. ChDrAdgB13]|uniref:hypothetical protein n=1 Tax=Rahnella sp. ChDrAdgB13 TaxID=1850581 RepID=UPI001AD87407|nr:hypothetical protein [Rahnella sp. ChDrAdgB13]
MTRQESIDFYKLNGYREISNNSSGLSTDVLVHGMTVVRIGGDPGYSHFARLVSSTTSSLKNVVKIYSHNEPLGIINDSSINNEYSITEMELLASMSEPECIYYKKWASVALNEIRQGKKPVTDPFDLVDDIEILFIYAKKNNLGIDLVEPKNVMKRGDEFIILDPFA